MNQERIDYFKSKTNGVVFDENCNQLTELDYPDLYYYDREAALWACEFKETTGKIVEDGHNFSKGDKIKLLDWQIQSTCNLYGIKQKKNKLRRYWFVLELLPKKQGKSPSSALDAIFLTSADGQGRGQIFTVAGDKMQAKIIHENAKEMIRADPWLSKNMIIRRDHIEHPASSSTFWVTSAIEGTKHGPNLSGILFDEPHVYKDGELDRTLLKGIIARDEPVVKYTSTAGVRNCWFHVDKYAYAKNILNGVVRDDRWLVFLYEADVDGYIKKYGDTWKDGNTPWWAQEQVWKEVNPSYGVTVTKDYFDNQVTLIKNKPDELNAFLRLHLNVFTGTMVEWSIVNKWGLGSGKIEESYIDQGCHVSIYNSRPYDMTCFAWTWNGNYMWKILCTSESAEQRVIATPGFSQWLEQGHVLVIPGNKIVADDVYEVMVPYLDKMDVKELTYRSEDEDLAQKLHNKYNMPLRPVSLKGKAITAATTTFEDWMSSGKVRHGDNPVAFYQLSVTEIVKIDDISRPSSDKSSDNICCIFAILFLVMSLMSIEEVVPSVYESRDMRVL